MQGEAVLRASLKIYQAMAAAGNPTEMARVLMQLEELLAKAGLMRRSWAEHWQHSWQRAVSYCVDWKHALLLTSTLQVCPTVLHIRLMGRVCMQRFGTAILAHALHIAVPWKG